MYFEFEFQLKQSRKNKVNNVLKKIKSIMF